MLDLKTLKVFITVADLANMTAAAKRLGLDHAIVSVAGASGSGIRCTRAVARRGIQSLIDTGIEARRIW